MDLRVLGNSLFWAAATSTFLAGCDSPDRAPAGFSPAQVTVREHDHIARCNTVHSLTVPASLSHRYGIAPDENTAVITCALQVATGAAPANVAAQVQGSATAQAGRATSVEFKKVVGPSVILYLGSFALTDSPAIELNVRLTDLRTGAAFDLQLAQAGLPGRMQSDAAEDLRASTFVTR